VSLFAVHERENVKDFLINLAERSGNILAAILVGSGSVGFTDELSDIDICLVVDSDENIEKAMDYMSFGIREYFQVAEFVQMLQRGLQVYLLDNFLELDVGYMPINNVTARRKRWKVVFDKAGTVDNDMKASWEKAQQENSVKTLESDKNLVSLAGDVWHYLFHAAVAIKRDEYWRSIGEMDIARNMLIELKGFRYSLSTKRYREIDNFPCDELAVIQKTLPSCLSQKSLLDNLYCLVDAVYDELEAYCSKYIVITRQQVMEYIKCVSSLITL